MMKFIYKLQRFMMGRYGIDEVYKFLFVIYMLLFLLGLFVKWEILTYLEVIVVVIMFYRVFSKNISSRKKEEKLYLQLKKKVSKPFYNIKRNFLDRDYYVYKKCHNCSKTLKLPLPPKRGIQKVKCPSCKKKIKFLCLRMEKVEVIKK